MNVILTGRDLTLDEVVRVARGRERVELAAEAVERMRESRALVERAVARGDPVYGTTTGVGVRKRFRADSTPEFNRRLILDHRVGQGPPAGEDVVRATMLRLANGFASGESAATPELAERLVTALNDQERPRVRSLGSTGVADLAPLADLAFELFGSVELAPKDAPALVNAGAYSTALATLALADCLRLADVLDVAGALDLEAFAANLSILHPRVPAARPYPGLARSIARLRALLAGSRLWGDGQARNLQDPLVYRCLPQLHGALRDAVSLTERHVGIELNASQDNPLAVPEEDRFVPVGNFELLPLAQALDLARLALAPALTSACERGVKLLQAPLSGLPEGLAARAGLASCGLSEFAFALQALTAEARLLAQPVSYEVVSTSQAEGIEDRITMAPLAARRLAGMVALGERIVAIELVLAAQAVDLRPAFPLGTGTEAAYAAVRELVPFMAEDAPIPQDLEPVVALVRDQALTSTRPSSTRDG
jgi:histidine ammonia-lyase